MKPTLLLLTTCNLLLAVPPALAQYNYSAGAGSGTGGNNNVFVGVNAGSLNSSGSFNSFLGAGAGYANSSGSYNSFVGSRAGVSNTTGAVNSFLGSYAGYRNTTGNANSFVGYQAGYNNTTGRGNCFVGTYAGSSNSIGNNNSFLGTNAGYYNDSGENNVFVGTYAGYSNSTGKHNSFVGYQAGLSNSSGYDNLFFGMQAGYQNTVGYANAFVGFWAGYNNTTGYSNTLFGSQAGYAATTAARNSFFGNFAGQNTTIGSENVFLGRSAGEKNVNGYFNASLGNYAGPTLANLQNASTIGYRASVSASNSLVLGSINGVNGATADTKVGIGTTAPGYLLHVNGSAAKPGGGSWTVASDQRLKQDISEFKDGLELVQKIKPVWFRYNGQAGLPQEKKFVGVIAQEMQQIAPYTVGEFTYTDTTGKVEQYLDYDANALTYMLVNSVKELQQENEAVKAENAALMQRLLVLETAVSQLTGEPTKARATSSAAQLYQNEPNPTEGSTLIRYFLPQETTSAQLKVYSLTGVEVRSVELTQQGNGQVKLSVGGLAAGEYVYHLWVNGQSIASKKLLLEK